MSLFSMILCGYQPEWQKNGILRKEYVTLYSYTPENYISFWFSEYSILKCCQSVRGMCEISSTWYTCLLESNFIKLSSDWEQH